MNNQGRPAQPPPVRHHPLFLHRAGRNPVAAVPFLITYYDNNIIFPCYLFLPEISDDESIFSPFRSKLPSLNDKSIFHNLTHHRLLYHQLIIYSVQSWKNLSQNSPFQSTLLKILSLKKHPPQSIKIAGMALIIISFFSSFYIFLGKQI